MGDEHQQKKRVRYEQSSDQVQPADSATIRYVKSRGKSQVVGGSPFFSLSSIPVTEQVTRLPDSDNESVDSAMMLMLSD
jgi:hypothetical protein